MSYVWESNGGGLFRAQNMHPTPAGRQLFNPVFMDLDLIGEYTTIGLQGYRDLGRSIFAVFSPHDARAAAFAQDALYTDPKGDPAWAPHCLRLERHVITAPRERVNQEAPVVLDEYTYYNPFTFMRFTTEAAGLDALLNRIIPLVDNGESEEPHERPDGVHIPASANTILDRRVSMSMLLAAITAERRIPMATICKIVLALTQGLKFHEYHPRYMDIVRVLQDHTQEELAAISDLPAQTLARYLG